MSHEMTTNKKKNAILKCHLLLFYATTMNHFSIRLWHVTKSEFCITQWLVWEEVPKHFLKPSLQQKKKGHGHCWVVCCPSDPLQLSESQRNHYIWELCSANRWDAPKTTTLAASIGQQKKANSSLWQCLTACDTTNISKVEWIGLWSFVSSAIFTWPLTNWLSLLQASQQLFAGKMLP